VLEGFSTKIFFGGGLGQHDAKYASELAGTCTVASVAETRHRDLLRGRWVARMTTPVPRPVLLPEEVARPPVHPLLGSASTVFLPGRWPFQAYFPAGYELPIPSACLREGVDIEAELNRKQKASERPKDHPSR
jgi:hypothetical protein